MYHIYRGNQVRGADAAGQGGGGQRRGQAELQVRRDKDKTRETEGTIDVGYLDCIFCTYSTSYTVFVIRYLPSKT